MRKNFSTGAKWEEIVGYSRAVLIGNQLEVTGTVAVNENGELVGPNNAYEQTRFILGKIERVMMDADFSMTDVIRTRIFVTDISRWEDVGRAHQEYFGKIRPATTMVEVKGLIAPEYLVEIEVSAVKESD